MKCGFCGYEFDEGDEGVKACSGCPMSGRCGKVKCPRCGYENVKNIGLLKRLGFGRKDENGK